MLNFYEVGKTLFDTSSKPAVNLDILMQLQNLYAPTHSTGGSQGFSNKKAKPIEKISFYRKYPIVSDFDPTTYLDLLMYSFLTNDAEENEYRIDKSLTADFNYPVNDLFEIGDDDLNRFSDIYDQPNFSYIKAYKHAKKIGFPASYGL